jgi:ferredoxin
VLSREPREAELLTGRLDVAKLTELLPRLIDSARADHWWLCGPFEMVGTCRARVTSGEVHMRRNFALEEPEVAAGFVLTCQSLPVSDSLAIDYDA